MNTGPDATKRKWPIAKTIVISILVLLILSGVYLYRNFNKLLSESLLKSFNSSVISDVYELKFENLQVNLFNGSIRVFNVSVIPREKPLKEYPYINSSFSLTTEDLLLEDVEIRTLLKENRLILNRILIDKSEIEFLLNGSRHIMLPFKDTTATVEEKERGKRPIESFALNEFQLRGASFHSINSDKQREFRIKDLNIAMHDLHVGEQFGEYTTSSAAVTLSIGELSGDLKKGGVRHLNFNNLEIGIDSINVDLTLDTLTYRFHDFSTKLQDLEIQTSDSIFQVTMKSFDLSYADESISIKEVSVKPNVSHAVIQNKFRFQHTEFSGSMGTLNIKKINFDSLIYAQKLLIDEVELEDVKAFLFKDKIKIPDSSRFPVYPGQNINGIELPLYIRKVKATKVDLENTERKADSTEAVVTITKATLEVENITNRATNEKLVIRADAFIDGKVRFKTMLTFSYSKPQFGFEGNIGKFDLPDLNPLLQAYTPAKINKGVADEIVFKGLADETSASGTMRFLFHDLEVDLELQKKAKWISDLLAFTANTVLLSSNPISDNEQPREVKFSIQRNMNKGFVNVIIKSVLNGLKETMVMNKANRKAYKQNKKKSREEK